MVTKFNVISCQNRVIYFNQWVCYEVSYLWMTLKIPMFDIFKSWYWVVLAVGQSICLKRVKQFAVYFTALKRVLWLDKLQYCVVKKPWVFGCSLWKDPVVCLWKYVVGILIHSSSNNIGLQDESDTPISSAHLLNKSLNVVKNNSIHVTKPLWRRTIERYVNSFALFVWRTK